ncbi:alpha/beta hydrolase family protein [Kribbella deserti]|uniref:alpha/beta hydrolase family protein n=1 Tax=Kribbella deserti TaxID=1926257 RepID=UPI0036D2D641
MAAPANASDLILFAHGGVVDSTDDPHAWRPPILRMWPFAAAARQADPSALVGLMRYRYRGWNGTAAHPAADLRTVLDRLPDRITRVLLIGHSMGGRAVVALGNHPKVYGVLALAPWLPAGEPSVWTSPSESARTPSGSEFTGAPIVFAHGDQDRITDPDLTAAYANRLRRAGIPGGLLSVEGESHAMLNRAADWSELVRRFVQHTLGPGDPFLADTLTTELSGPTPLPRWNRPGATPAGVLQTARARLSQRITAHL